MATRRRWWLGAGLGLAGLVVFVLVWFEPQALFIDDRVSDPVPTVPPVPAEAIVAEEPDRTSTTAAATPTGPVELATGSFVSRDHGTTGAVRILELEDGSRFVRLEGLDTDNGPDLYIYLSPHPADADEQAFEDGYVDLGRLQGNLGDQNYALPADVDLTRYRSVVIWCDRFDSAFGAADLA